MVNINKGLSPAERAELDNASAGAVNNSRQVAAVTSMIASTAGEMIAPENLVEGDPVIVGDVMYKAIVNIPRGTELIEMGNVVKCTLAEWVASLQN